MMKNKGFLAGMSALALTFGLVLAGCSSDSGDSGDTSGPVYLGDSFTLEGQVYRVSEQFLSYTLYSGNLDVDANTGETGKIEKGKLDITIVKPKDEDLDLVTDAMILEGYTDVKVSPDSTKGTILVLTTSEGSTLIRAFKKQSSQSRTTEMVLYMYVDTDVKITAKGTSVGDEKLTDINVSLKKGWNTLYAEIEVNVSDFSSTTSISLNNPNILKWELQEGGGN